MLSYTVVFSQTVRQLEKAGDKKMAEASYYAASRYYADAVKKDEENIDLQFKLAESLRLFNDYGNAAQVYRTVTRLDKTNRYPLAHYWLGTMLRSVCACKLDEALNAFKKFRVKYKTKDFYGASAQQQMEACSWVIDHKNPTDSIKIEHLGKDVNTEKSEFNAMHVFPDRLQFSALRNISTDKKNEKYLARIYNQLPNPAEIYMPNGADASLNIGNGAYSADGKAFYFTQCDPSTSRCDIYVTQYVDYNWTPAEKLSDHVNNATATNTHPSPGYDLQGNEVLFFSSNREGGQGGMDIWMSRKNSDGTYRQAVNAGNTINTPGNEVTPFYDVNNQLLYFSSDWHYGFGGYDIFSAKGEYTNWSSPQNLLLPVNSPQNDLYYALAADDSKAYITSNRTGSYFIEAETCCNDIYAYKTNRQQTKKDTPVAVVKDTVPIQPVVTDEPVQPKNFIDEQVKKMKQMLPVALYFHNDEPDARTLADTTTLDYKTTYERYTLLRREYEREFSRTEKNTDAKIEAQQKIAQLFDSYVDKGYYDLVAFTAQLFLLLQKGNKLEVTIKGYCSPLNYNEYNIKLGMRRVASLRNYFYHYREGALLPYITSGQLLLKNESLGEETAANKGISDNREDKRNSVYNPVAALERRVEIISVELK